MASSIDAKIDEYVAKQKERIEKKEINIPLVILKKALNNEPVDRLSLFNKVLEAENYDGPDSRTRKAAT